MALTAAEKVSLKVILELPQGGTIYEVSPTGQQVITWSPDGTIETKLDAALAALSAEQLTALSALIAAWDALGTNALAIRGGAIGGISGISYDPADKRREIKRQVASILPFVRGPEEYRRPRSCSVEVVS
jgi:hypothetical protein